MVGAPVRTALVLGGAACLHDDIAAYTGPVDGVVACNDAGAECPGHLDAWVTLHPAFLLTKGWLAKRAERGYPAAARLVAHDEINRPVHRAKFPEGLEFTDYRFPGQTISGSSGLFAAKVALMDLGFGRVVLCGVPMVVQPHFYGGEAWRKAEDFRAAWLSVPEEYRARMRSMSGWTRVLCGGPQT